MFPLRRFDTPSPDWVDAQNNDGVDVFRLPFNTHVPPHKYTLAACDQTSSTIHIQILRHARGQGNIHFPCSADHEQDWQPYPVDPYSAICDDHTYIPLLDD